MCCRHETLRCGKERAGARPQRPPLEEAIKGCWPLASSISPFKNVIWSFFFFFFCWQRAWEISWPWESSSFSSWRCLSASWSADLRDDRVHSSHLTDEETDVQRSDLLEASQLLSDRAGNTEFWPLAALSANLEEGIAFVDLPQGYLAKWELLPPKFGDF